MNIICVSDQVLEVSAEVLSKMHFSEGVWRCLSCGWGSKYKSRTFDHVEAKHVDTPGYSCALCDKFCPSYSYSSLKMHKSRYHKQTLNPAINY